MNETSETAYEENESSAVAGNVAGWYLDQTGRFEFRYWDGSSWTEHVRSGFREQTDPLIGGAVHVRLGDLAPSERVFEDIGFLLRGARPQETPPPDFGEVEPEPQAAQATGGEPNRLVDEDSPGDTWRVQVRTQRVFIWSVVAVGLALIPVVGTVSVLVGGIALVAALSVRRKCTRLGIGASRAVDASLLSVLAIVVAIANLLVTLQLSNQGRLVEAVACSLESPVARCLGDLLSAAGAVIRSAVFGG